MSKADVYRRYAVPVPPDGAPDRQVKGFTQANLTKVYQGATRRYAATLGRPAPPIGPLRPDVAQTIVDRAERVARTIPTGTNRAIQAALNRMPDGLSDAEYDRRLQPALQAIHDYNAEQLIPRLRDQTIHDAQMQLLTRNGISATVTFTRTSGLSTPDACQNAEDQSPMPVQDAAGLTVPFHPHCACTATVDAISPDSVPATLDLGT